MLLLLLRVDQQLGKAAESAINALIKELPQALNHWSSICSYTLLPLLLQVKPQLGKAAETAMDALTRELPPQSLQCMPSLPCLLLMLLVFLANGPTAGQSC